MKLTLAILLVFGGAISSTLANCWWTGCQPKGQNQNQSFLFVKIFNLSKIKGPLRFN